MNRFVTTTDISVFEKFLTPNNWVMKIGDYIFDTFNVSTSPKRIMITDVSNKLSALQEGATIWFDSEKLNGFECIQLTNETLKKDWHIQNVKFRPIPNAQLNLKRGVSSYATIIFKINGLKFPDIKFDSIQYPGFYGLTRNDVFSRDKFGLVIDSDGYFQENGFALHINTPDGGHQKISGIAGGGGSFAFLRRQSENNNKTVTGELTNCFGYGTCSETEYDGYTSGWPWNGLKNWVVKDCYYSRSGTESFQIQHLRGGADLKMFAFNSDVRWISAFQKWQDSSIQISVDNGVNKVQSVFVDGFGSNGVVFYQGDYTQTTGSVLPPSASDELIIDKAYIYGGHLAVYGNNSCNKGMTWRIKELYVGGMNDEYATVTGNKPVTYYIQQDGTDKIIVENLYHDGSRPNLVKDTKIQVLKSILLTDFPRPKYKFSNYKFLTWAPAVANYHPIIDKALKIKAGTYWIDDEEGTSRTWLKAIKDHVATAIRPKNDSINFVKLTWDSKGKCSDEIGFDFTQTQRTYPPDNFTQTFDSPLKLYSYFEDETQALRDQIISLQLKVTDLENKILNLDSLLDQSSTQINTYKQKISEVISILGGN